jgi:Gelsolin repeat
MCTLGTVVTLDHGDGGDDSDKEFWAYLGKGEIAPAVPDDAEEVTEFTPTLFRVDGDPKLPLEKVATGTPVKKGHPEVCLKKAALDDSNVYLVDAGWELFIWIGSGAECSEKVAAMGAADRYAEVEPRANYLPVTIVKSGKECESFLSYFD